MGLVRLNGKGMAGLFGLKDIKAQLVMLRGPTGETMRMFRVRTG